MEPMNFYTSKLMVQETSNRIHPDVPNIRMKNGQAGLLILDGQSREFLEVLSTTLMLIALIVAVISNSTLLLMTGVSLKFSTTQMVTVPNLKPSVVIVSM
jgi:hypothetical protein